MHIEYHDSPTAIIIVQPWAWAVVNGVRTSHVFGHRPKHLGPGLVYAARSHQFLTPMALSNCPGHPAESRLEFGAFIGLVEIVEFEREGSQWKWTFEHPRPIVPIEYRGNLRTLNVADEIWDQVQVVHPNAAAENS
jgi:hypothetical protein